MTTNERPTHITPVCKGTNRACKKAVREGRPLHVIPPAIDGQPWIVLPTYHFVNEEEALRAVLDAMRDAPLVTCDEDLYRFRAEGIAHKIPRGFIDPTRR
jgi:hypothetical protein